MEKRSSQQISVDEVVDCIKHSVTEARNELEFRARVSTCIEEGLLKSLGIVYVKFDDYVLVFSQRSDALYELIVIVYSVLDELSTSTGLERVIEQIANYIKTEVSSKSRWDKCLGVAIGNRIAFVKYSKSSDRWVLKGPYDITEDNIIRFVGAVRGLMRRALEAQNLLKDFGFDSAISRRAIGILYTKLSASTSPKTRELFKRLREFYKQTLGIDLEKVKDVSSLVQQYGVADSASFDVLLFAIQTYYALLVKLLIAEVTSFFNDASRRSFIIELKNKYLQKGIDGLRESLEELESGRLFRKLGYENFIEGGELFSWYLQEIDEELAEVLVKIAEKLEDYEPSTFQLEPGLAKDLLKKLYQNLIPKSVRHSLGEYYTPDWLADLLLDEVGLSLEDLRAMGKEDPLRPLEIRVLDPACGSGTFLIRYIARLRVYAEERSLVDVLIDYVLENVVGYDLNPLAVLTARANYLLLLADIIKKKPVEIPVYIADSLRIEKSGQDSETFYVVKTVVGEFKVPLRITRRDLLEKLITEIAKALNDKVTVKGFRERLRKTFRDLSNTEENSLAELYEALAKLEEKENGSWTSVLRNALAPLLKDKFDYVIGNPPWVNWDNLSESYRREIKTLWKRYGLDEGRGRGLGKVKRDLAILFFARCFDLYLKAGGKLVFLMPFTVFKTQAGAGFRRFLVEKTTIHTIHDLVATRPFEGATNMTSAVVVEKTCELEDSRNAKVSLKTGEEDIKIKNVIWVTKKAISPDASLEEVIKSTIKYEAIMVPVVERDPSSPWMQVVEEVLPHIRKVLGRSPYRAHEGVNVALNQVYYVQVRGKTPEGKLIVVNPFETRQKKRVEQIQAVVEPDLVFPLIRGRDVKKWHIEYRGRYILLPVDSEGEVIPHSIMRSRYLGAWSYFKNFFNDLVNRGGEPYGSKLKAYREKSFEEAEAVAPPFYWVFNTRPSLAPYKVVWKNIAGGPTGKAELSCAVAGKIIDEYVGLKPLVPNAKLMLIPLSSEEEAYYVSGVLNSTIVRFVVASYVTGTGISTHVVDHIYIPKFDPKVKAHRRIAELSKKAHELAKRLHSSKESDSSRVSKDLVEELKKVEEEIDKLVTELYGISEKALHKIRELLALLTYRRISIES
ncbi:MAG: N-6 DNA methylase [Acidilobaceae archaeon]